MPTIVCRCFRVCQWASSLRYRTAFTPRRPTLKRSAATGASPIETSASRPARSPASGCSTSTATTARRALRALEAQHGKLPATWISSTGRGWHVWLRYTAPIPSSTGRIAPSLDVKADGGYVVAPPSIHPSGRAYTWLVPPEGEPAEAPGWLVTLARKRPTPSISERAIASIRRPNGKPDRYGAAALDREIAALAATAPGSRNAALNRASFCLFQLVAGGELDGRDVADRLVEACHRNGLVKDDGLRAVVATIRSGSRAGLQHPRSRSGAA